MPLSPDVLHSPLLQVIDTCLLECGHCVLCFHCASMLARKVPSSCPLCRLPISIIARLTSFITLPDGGRLAVSGECYTVNTDFIQIFNSDRVRRSSPPQLLPLPEPLPLLWTWNIIRNKKLQNLRTEFLKLTASIRLSYLISWNNLDQGRIGLRLNFHRTSMNPKCIELSLWLWQRPWRGRLGTARDFNPIYTLCTNSNISDISAKSRVSYLP